MSTPRHVPKRRASRPAPVAPRRRAVRPRYGRIGLAGTAASVTLLALLGGVGVLPLREVERPTYAGGRVAAAAGVPSEMVPAGGSVDVVERARVRDRITEAERRQATHHASRATRLDLPADSGQGRRAVFDMSAQRVWIVDSDGDVERTYLVSGSVLDNLDPGTYEVYSRSRHAVGIDDSGEMEYFVRFTRGENAAIGFHSIPTKDGRALQTRAQLGTPQSHGCIRQDLGDALAMWEFAQIGTTVVVTA